MRRFSGEMLLTSAIINLSCGVVKRTAKGGTARETTSHSFFDLRCATGLLGFLLFNMKLLEENYAELWNLVLLGTGIVPGISCGMNMCKESEMQCPNTLGHYVA